MVHKVLAPIKPTGGAVGVGLLVGFAGAAVCTQFLSLNMPFGGALPHTVTNPEWAKATAEIMKSSWEREGAPDRPIGLNPMKGPK